MLTYIDDLCRYIFIDEAINTKSGLDLKKFTEDLNTFIHKCGESGYNYADAFNLKVNKYYTEEEAKELLEQIKETKKLDKKDITIKEIDKVPYGMAQEIAEETHSGSETIEKAMNTRIKFGILRGYELIGFVSGNCCENIISIGGLFIREDYRSQGLSTKLLESMINSNKGLKGVSMSNASWEGGEALFRLKKHYDKLGFKTTFEEGEEDTYRYINFRFNNK